MGRTNVGSYAFASGQGLEHWQHMSSEPGSEVTRWHKMSGNSFQMLIHHSPHQITGAVQSRGILQKKKEESNQYHFTPIYYSYINRLFYIENIFVEYSQTENPSFQQQTVLLMILIQHWETSLVLHQILLMILTAPASASSVASLTLTLMTMMMLVTRRGEE